MSHLTDLLLTESGWENLVFYAVGGGVVLRLHFYGYITKYEIVYFKNMIKNKWQKVIIIRIK